MVRKRINFADIPKVITADVERVFRGACFELFARIIYSTPVGKPELWSRPAPPGYVPGHLRGSWGISVGGGSTSRNAIDVDGSATTSQGLQDLAKYKAGLKVKISNNVVYGPRIEFTGWSKQAPQGMVRINVADWSSIVREVAAGQAKVRG